MTKWVILGLLALSTGAAVLAALVALHALVEAAIVIIEIGTRA